MTNTYKNTYKNFIKTLNDNGVETTHVRRFKDAPSNNYFELLKCNNPETGKAVQFMVHIKRYGKNTYFEIYQPLSESNNMLDDLKAIQQLLSIE